MDKAQQPTAEQINGFLMLIHTIKHFGGFSACEDLLKSLSVKEGHEDTARKLAIYIELIESFKKNEAALLDIYEQLKHCYRMI